MPKYTNDKVDGYYLYFTSKCIVEAMHVHAGKSTTNGQSTKFWVYEDGSSTMVGKSRMSAKTEKAIKEYIAVNYLDMYATWQRYSNEGFKQK